MVALNWLRSDAHQIMYSTLGNSAICCTLGAYAQRERGAQSKEREMIRTYIRTSVSEQLSDKRQHRASRIVPPVSVHDKANDVDTQHMTIGGIVCVARLLARYLYCSVHFAGRPVLQVLFTIGRLCCYCLEPCNTNALPVYWPPQAVLLGACCLHTCQLLV